MPRKPVKRGRPMTPANAKRAAEIKKNNTRYKLNHGISLKPCPTLALANPEARARAYESYCEHIANGYPEYCWCYYNEDLNEGCCLDTLKAYLERFPDELNQFFMRKAKSMGSKFWVDKGLALVDGTLQGNSAVYAMMMRNINKWDREQQVSHTINVAQVNYADVNPLDNEAND